ncbi:S1 family peptidase [Blastopirellula sp. JC732]|uniref:S1 family peptidase n=1 Tax=Blastopirellula sediminis TaxID=2894196 RepID=A0A9X1MJL3_9BACT|nr:serine protease [Blastopirellula sediminis]MCC9608900.1 S1 family peptidase [Blastopirellula sediminis]MCC9628323.1 S1 family peptidase [Blastopirellula sediminis]
MLRSPLLVFSALVCFASFAAPLLAKPGDKTLVASAVYRFGGTGSNATGWVVKRVDPKHAEKTEYWLVTATHVLTAMQGEKATLTLRKFDAEKDLWERAPLEVAIRSGEKNLWTEAGDLDVAVMRLPDDIDPAVDSIPFAWLSPASDWESLPIEAGQMVRCVGFPHASQFNPSKAGYPMVRLGCIASVTREKEPMFLVDFNTFEGDSGGLVYLETEAGDIKVIGLTRAQHFLDERYKLVYGEGLIRQRLGLSIVVPSERIRQLIESADQTEAPTEQKTKIEETVKSAAVE